MTSGDLCFMFTLELSFGGEGRCAQELIPEALSGVTGRVPTSPGRTPTHSLSTAGLEVPE